jgi:hypothetical protein
MEKFRIAQYGFIQMVALSYGILGSGLISKATKTMMGSGYPVSPWQFAITLYHDYGVFLSLIIIGWASFCAYHSTIFSKRNMNEETIVASGLFLTALFFVLGTIVIFMSFSLAFRLSA